MISRLHSDFALIFLLAATPFIEPTICTAQGLKLIPPYPHNNRIEEKPAPPHGDDNFVAIAKINPMTGTMKYICAGVLVDEDRVLTACHAVDRPSHGQLCVLLPHSGAISLTIDSSDDLRLVKAIVNDRETRDDSHEDVVSVLELDRSVPMCDRRAENSIDLSSNFYTLCWTATDKSLVQLYIPMTRTNMDEETPAVFMPESDLENETYIIAQAENEDECPDAGDSGAPLYMRDIGMKTPRIIGIASFQITSAKNKKRIAYINTDNSLPSKILRNNTATADKLASIDADYDSAGVIALPDSDRPATLHFTQNDIVRPGGKQLIKYILIHPNANYCRLTITERSAPDKNATKPYVTVQNFPQFALVAKSYVDESLTFQCEKEAYYLIGIELRDSGNNRVIQLSVTTENANDGAK